MAVALEHRRAHLARHAWAGVLDRQAQAGALTVGTNPDRSVLWGVPCNVGQQLLDDTLHLVAIQPDRS